MGRRCWRGRGTQNRLNSRLGRFSYGAANTLAAGIFMHGIVAGCTASQSLSRQRVLGTECTRNEVVWYVRAHSGPPRGFGSVEEFVRRDRGGRRLRQSCLPASEKTQKNRPLRSRNHTCRFHRDNPWPSTVSPVRQGDTRSLWKQHEATMIHLPHQDHALSRAFFLFESLTVFLCW